MAVEIHDLQAERLARELTELIGEPPGTAVLIALQERLERVQLGRDLKALIAEVAGYPVQDRRIPEQIIGYGRDGLP